MVKMYTAFTNQIDNPEAAVREILEQLKLEENKLKNTIGIVHFYYEFVETEGCKAIVEALPFELVGCVSSYVGINKQYGDIALTVTMLTSDDVNFSIRTIEGINGKSIEQVGDEVVQMCKELCIEEKPKLIMPFLSMATSFTADNLIDIVNTLPDQPPFFGTIGFDMSIVVASNTSTHCTLVNGKISPDTHVYVAFYGNFEPKFHVTSAFFEFQSGSVDVTDVSGNILKTLGGMPALEYLTKQGIMMDKSIRLLPAILTYPNGTKVVRAFLGVVEGTQFIRASSFIKPGAKITFAHLDSDKTVASAAHLVKEITKTKANNAIMHSCAARAMALGTKYFAEAEKIDENATFNYSLAYSGGEICPIWDNEGEMINTLHGYTIVACTF
jgi:hypothetical protein